MRWRPPGRVRGVREGLVKIRVMGTRDEVFEAVTLLMQVFEVLGVDGPYENRRGSRSMVEDQQVRAYAEVRLRRPEDQPVTVRFWVARTDRPEVGLDAPKQIGYSSRRRKGG